jgi:hypothetical protein
MSHEAERDVTRLNPVSHVTGVTVCTLGKHRVELSPKRARADSDLLSMPLQHRQPQSVTRLLQSLNVVCPFCAVLI